MSALGLSRPALCGVFPCPAWGPSGWLSTCGKCHISWSHSVVRLDFAGRGERILLPTAELLLALFFFFFFGGGDRKSPLCDHPEGPGGEVVVKANSIVMWALAVHKQCFLGREINS